MAKMMMGQIDHARKRVAELKREKQGIAPASPTIKKGSDLLEDMRKEVRPRTVTGPQLKAAFAAFVDEVPMKDITVDTGNHYNRDRKTVCKIRQTAPSSVEGALAKVIYAKENSAELERFEAETAIYNLRQEALSLEASMVEDAIVLGDQKEALLALNNFAAFVVGF